MRKSRSEPFFIAAKLGMQVNPDPGGYTRRNMTAFIESSLRQLQVDTIDLIQLHCPPIEDFFLQARQHKVGIIARVPLASGLLSGKMTPSTAFASDDHRSFNREGVEYETGLQAVRITSMQPICRR